MFVGAAEKTREMVKVTAGAKAAGEGRLYGAKEEPETTRNVLDVLLTVFKLLQKSIYSLHITCNLFY
ncbi:hypothetical protein L1987_36108 [Smallanthus sonchifolius]|uniref:Uncharacterized protein n=1 Tax=Smallanthus sonchifolius TaxID=185202 RepID=A0ACB9HCN8_9ASTR|nr:hypothetical protein L1987_36108 [Smallanthus sonchifolius]